MICVSTANRICQNGKASQNTLYDTMSQGGGQMIQDIV